MGGLDAHCPMAGGPLQPTFMNPLHHPAPPEHWHASWLWGDRDPADHNVYRYFRRTFDLDDPAGHVLHITGSNRYQLYVNGQRIGEGPPPSSCEYHFFDSRDVSAHLRRGANCIAVLVHYLGGKTGDAAGLLAQLNDADGRCALATDAQWKTLAGMAWDHPTFRFAMNRYDPYQEFCDARRAPVGWKAVDFDASDWSAPKVLGPALGTQPWSTLVPRDIPFMGEQEETAEALHCVEESLAVQNRMRPDDLTIALSVPGRPIKHTTVTDAENLLSDTGATVVQCSTDHLADHTFDGVYDPCIVLDFGKVITAHLELELDGVDGGMVDVGFAERLTDGYFVNSIEGQFAARYTMTGGPQVWRTSAWRGYRYAKLRFRDCFQPVTVRRAVAIQSRYPFELAGDFESSDDRLNAIWQISRHGTWLCCHESIMDTPWREQAQWLGDVAAVSLGSIYACFGDRHLPAKFLRQSAANRQPSGLISNMTNFTPNRRGWRSDIPDYSLWWAISVWQHFLYTADRPIVESLYPVARDIVDAHHRHVDETGLITDMPYWVFIDWANVEKRGKVGALNAIYHETLWAMMHMAKLLRLDDDVAEYQRRRDAIAAAFDDHFFDAQRGLYIDCCANGQRSDRVSEHTNFAAIWAGLCRGDRAHAITGTLLVDNSVEKVEAQPFFNSVVLRALDRIGRFDLAMAVIRDRWGGRFVDRGHSSCIEEWTQNGSWRLGEFLPIMRSHSHAWSACPGEFLLRDLIGLRIVEPGGVRVQVSPRDAGADYRVTYPLPAGPLVVERKQNAVRVEAPDGVTVEQV